MTGQRAGSSNACALSPEIAEAIALLIPCSTSLQRFVTALPASATTSALASLARLYAEPAVNVAWPNVMVRSPNMSRAASKDLAAIAALAPKSVIVGYKIKERSDLEVVVGLAPWVTQMTFYIGEEALNDVIDPATWAYYRTTLASCQRLETLAMSDFTAGYGALDGVFLELPRLTSLTISAYNDYEDRSECHVTPDFTSRLTTWLQTRPVTHLAMDYLWLGLDPEAPLVLALCDAISNSTTLSALKLNNVDIFRDFLNGRPLPPHLKRLEWDVNEYEGTEDTELGWENFVSAFINGPQLEHLGCKHFQLLLGQHDMLEKLQGLTSIEAHQLGDDIVETLDLMQLLSDMPNLTQLQLKNSNFDDETAGMLFATVCMRTRLETLGLASHQLEADDIHRLFQVLLHFPQSLLKHLDLSEQDFDVDDIIDMLPTLNAAAEHLQVLQLHGSWDEDELMQLATAAQQLPDRHFVIEPRCPPPAFCEQWRDSVTSPNSSLCRVLV